MLTYDQVIARNTDLVSSLEKAADVIKAQKEEIEKLSGVPQGFGIFIEAGPEDTADVFINGHRMRVATTVPVAELRAGQRVVLNEAPAVIAAESMGDHGAVAKVAEVLPDGRLVVCTGAEELTVVHRGGQLASVALRTSDSVLVDLRAGLALGVVTRDETADLMLEEVPDIAYSDIGGLAKQVEEIRDAIELPFLQPEMFKKYSLRHPRGVLLYGPPGCGKTLVAKAVANSLAKQKGGKASFINIKGPELLNKYVGETERKIREIFAKAREKATPENPVIIFFDEMESMFRTRGSGVSSDVESTTVPQLLAEIDGVDETSNVIVIGATNRQDLIDPAVLRPGRLDVKVQVSRPDMDAAKEILGIYLTYELPYKADTYGYPEALAKAVVEKLYSTDKDSEFIEVTYVNGQREVMHFKDFTSGAMIENIVNRAKKAAIKDELADKGEGITLDHLLEAVADEFRETEDLPNTTNPDDWARISGKKGERIAAVRPLLKKEEEDVQPLGTYL